MTKNAILTLEIAGENIEIAPTPALFRDLDERCGSLIRLAEKIEAGQMRHAEMLDALEVLAFGRLHREEIESGLVTNGAGEALSALARLLAVYISGMKRLEALFPPGEAAARG